MGWIAIAYREQSTPRLSTHARLGDKTDYWNHNSAYHSWIVRVAAEHRGRALDVGCGEGLLVQRLASASASVTGIDPDRVAIARARDRIRGLPNVTLEESSFLDYAAPEGSFDVVTFVASLHHMEPVAAIRKARTLLSPGGDLIVVGLSANKSAADWLLSVFRLPFVRLGSTMHHETRDIGVVGTNPQESLGEIRELAHRELPGVQIRRAFYYRYLLRWRKPELFDASDERFR